MRRIAILLAASILTSANAGAQDRNPTDPGTGVMIAVNVLVGAATGGIGNASAGRSFWTGAAKGASGGFVMFAGKKFISQKGASAAWIGRQLAAAGTSQVRNAAAGVPIFSEFVLPLGITRIYVKTSGRPKVAMRLDLATTIATAIMAGRSGTTFELGESLSNGALMFSEEFGGDSVAGSHLSGAIRVDRIPAVASNAPPFAKSAVTAHELIHATQYDFVGIALSEPLEALLFNRTKAGRTIKKYVDPGILSPVWGAVNAILPRNERPWEMEAHSLSPGG